MTICSFADGKNNVITAATTQHIVKNMNALLYEPPEAEISAPMIIGEKIPAACPPKLIIPNAVPTTFASKARCGRVKMKLKIYAKKVNAMDWNKITWKMVVDCAIRYKEIPIIMI